MKYCVMLFYHGEMSSKTFTEAKSHREAVIKVVTEKWNPYDTAVAVNKKLVARRYEHRTTRDGGAAPKLLKTAPRVFKTHSGGKPAILLMMSNLSELYKFKSKAERNKAYKLCTTFAPVESVEKNKEPSDITAYSGEMSDSSAGLMWTKTSNGCVTNAIWMDALIPFPTGKISGGDKSSALVAKEWYDGSTAFPSKQKSTFATVKNLKDFDGTQYPMITPEMVELSGKTIRIAGPDSKGFYHGKGFMWRKEWLDFSRVTLTVIESLGASHEGWTMVPHHREQIGKTLSFSPCGDHYTCAKGCFSTDWLVPPEGAQEEYKIAAAKKKIEEISKMLAAIKTDGGV